MSTEKLIKEMMKNRVLSVPVRLGIMLYLLARGEARFSDVQNALNLTPGNLWSHVRRLEDVGYVKIYRRFEDRPRTVIKITGKGIDEVSRYLNNMLDIAEKLLKATRKGGGEGK